MLSIIRLILLDIIQWLPRSPFRAQYDNVNYVLNFLPYLNWIVPFDIALQMINLWLPCIITYYCYDAVAKFVNDRILPRFSGLNLLPDTTE